MLKKKRQTLVWVLGCVYVLCAPVCVYVYMCVCCAHVCMRRRVYVCVCVCVGVCVYVCVCVSEKIIVQSSVLAVSEARAAAHVALRGECQA